MGHVFIVEHMQLGAYAAVKLAAPDSVTARDTLAHEAKLLSRVQHPHIVQVIDYGQTSDGFDFMLMQYVSGVELRAFIESSGPLPLERALPILRQLASAIDYLHAHGIVHSDIKPANILFDPCASDFVKLVDFGVAFVEDTRGRDRAATGTPAYMAPEQAPGGTCERSVDVYGLAALAFELVTGRLIGAYATRHAALQAALGIDDAVTRTTPRPPRLSQCAGTRAGRPAARPLPQRTRARKRAHSLRARPKRARLVLGASQLM